MTIKIDFKSLNIDEDEFNEFMYGTPEGFVEVSSVDSTPNGRWTVLNIQVFGHVATDTFWEASWLSGATECQELGTDEMLLTVMQVEPYEKTTTLYREVE